MPKAPAATRRAHITHLLTVEGGETMRLIGSVLFCHLLIEQVLYELLAHAARQAGTPLAPAETLTFADKIRRGRTTDLVVAGDARPILSETLADALLELNRLRVSLAHTYGASPTLEEIHDVVAALEVAGVDFTDDMAASPARARAYGYDGVGLILEATKHTFFDLAWRLAEAGGPSLVD